MAAAAGRTLVLLRHAKSAWPSGVGDHERPLAPRGRRDAPAAGDWLRAAGHVPDRVLCSTALRARQTWQLAQARLGPGPRVSFDDRVYQAPAATLWDLIRQAPPAAHTLLVVGHNPGIGDLALALSTPAPGPRGGSEGDPTLAGALRRMSTKFPTAAVAVWELGAPWALLRREQARLIGFVTPRDLAAGQARRS